MIRWSVVRTEVLELEPILKTIATFTGKEEQANRIFETSEDGEDLWWIQSNQVVDPNPRCGEGRRRELWLGSKARLVAKL